MATKLQKKKRSKLISQVRSTDGFNEIREICKTEGINISPALRYMDEGKENTWELDDIRDNILALDGLRIIGDIDNPCSKYSDFKGVYQKSLLWEKMGDIYNNALEGKATRNFKSKLTRSFLTSNDDNTPANPSRYLAPILDDLSPEIDITDLTTNINYINENSVQIPEIRTAENQKAANMIDNPEGEDTKLVTVGLGVKSATMTRRGIGISWSDMFESSPLSIPVLSMFALETGVNHSNAFNLVGIKELVSISRNSNITISAWSHRASQDLEHIKHNDKYVTAVLGRKKQILDYYNNRVTFYGGNLIPVDDGSLGNVRSSINILNYTTESLTDTGMTQTRLYLYNRSLTLGVIFNSREIVTVDNYDAKSDMSQRYFRRRGAWYSQHSAPAQYVTVPA